MAESLLQRFLEAECTPEVAAATLQRLRSCKLVLELEFNCFSSPVLREEGRVVLQDLLDVSPAGTLELSPGELFEGLRVAAGSLAPRA